MYYGVNPTDKREKLKNSVAAKPFLDEIIQKADVAINEASPAFKMSEYMLFYKNGNRRVFERGYFERRNKCFSILVAYWITEDEKYLMPLVDYITYICDEFSWCVPAHSFMENKPEGKVSEGVIGMVDLFQAETARLFAEIMMCVGDKLPEYTKDRMKYEVNRRVINTFENGTVCHWERARNNWVAVCGAGSAVAITCFGTEEQNKKYLPRYLGWLDAYLESIYEDGCCLEGNAYWGYGVEHFTILAELVRLLTDGKVNYFEKDKVRKLALFPQNVRMSDSKLVAFSDGGEVFKFKMGLICFFKKLYSEVQLPELKYGTYCGNVHSVCELLWFDDNYIEEARRNNTFFYDEAQWYISRKEKYSFAAKGGHNDEPHNHNDLGGFMITCGDETFISDLGCGEYIKETFMPETRYNYIQNSSRGHSVPIINGEYQKEGVEYSAKNVKATDDSFELDIAGAYEKGLVEEIKRSFKLYSDKIILRDNFKRSPNTKTLTERIVSKIKPELKDGLVEYGIGRISYDAKRYIASLSEDSFVAHNAVDVVNVYLVDFAPKNEDENEFVLEIIV